MLGQTKNLRNYGKNHGLIVVDMQGCYLEESDPELADKIPVLIQKVSLHINSCFSHGGRVIMIETDGAGNTREVLGRQIKRQMEFDILRKTRDSVLSKKCPHRKTNTEFLKQHDIPPQFSMVGIDTLACIRKTGNALVDIGLDVSLVPGATMNTDCIDHNLFECVERFRWARGILRDFKISKNKTKSLVDYL